MEVFYAHPYGMVVTLGIVVVVTSLVILEKKFSPKVRGRGGIYCAQLSFVVILLKTLIPLVVLWKLFNLSPASLGRVGADSVQAVWKGVVLAVFMCGFIFAYQKYSHLLFNTPYVSTGSHILEKYESRSAILVGSSASLLNAFGEEIIFRGMLFPCLSLFLGPGISLIVQSLIFTGYHLFPLQNSLLLFIMGIFFGVGYLWSGSLVTPIVAHLFVNGLPLVLMYFPPLSRT